MPYGTTVATHPRDKLDEVIVEGDTSLGVEDGRLGGSDEVSRDDLILGVTVLSALVRMQNANHVNLPEDTLHLVLGSLLDGRLDLVVRGGLLSADDEVDNGDVGGRDTEGHSGELAIELRDNLADSLRGSAGILTRRIKTDLGGTGGRRDDVVGSGSASSPVLCDVSESKNWTRTGSRLTVGWTVNSLLGGGSGVDSSHKTLDDAELFVRNHCELRDRCSRCRG